MEKATWTWWRLIFSPGHGEAIIFDLDMVEAIIISLEYSRDHIILTWPWCRL
jgi:hypothetical protein